MSAPAGDAVLRVGGSGWRDSVQIVSGPQAAVLIGPDVLSSTERMTLAFVLARLGGLLRPGCGRALALPAPQLAALLWGVATAARPGIPCPEPESTVAPLRAELSSLGPQILREAGRLIDELLPDLLVLDCAAWQRGMGRTADRLGLLLCNDVETAAGLCAARGQKDADAEQALLEFVLSDEYLAVRDELGLSVHV